MTEKDEMPTTVVTSGGTSTAPNYRQQLMSSRGNSRESSKNAGKKMKDTKKSLNLLVSCIEKGVKQSTLNVPSMYNTYGRRF
jgi:hypothetical protein